MRLFIPVDPVEPHLQHRSHEVTDGGGRQDAHGDLHKAHSHALLQQRHQANCHDAEKRLPPGRRICMCVRCSELPV